MRRVLSNRCLVRVASIPDSAKLLGPCLEAILQVTAGHALLMFLDVLENLSVDSIRVLMTVDELAPSGFVKVGISGFL